MNTFGSVEEIKKEYLPLSPKKRKEKFMKTSSAEELADRLANKAIKKIRRALAAK